MEHRDLVKRAKLGDKAAFTMLIMNRKSALYKTAFMYVKTEHDALEIVDETIYRAYLSLKNLKHNEYFNTWITRILINYSLEFKKKHSKIMVLNCNFNIKSVTSSNNCEEIMDLYDAVDRLEGKYKTVIILKYFNDMTIKDISKVMECSESNVKNYLHKALSNLRFVLKEDCVNE